MRIVNFRAENFQRLEVVEISPEGNMIVIGGNNGNGKTSILNAIWVALAGRGVAPPKPIRKGEEQCTIRLDLGDIVITRKFADKEGRLTDSVKVESADGSHRFNSPQTMLDELIGAVGFDPFAFVQMKPDRQAAMLMELVPLPIDLDEFAEQDASDYAIRRDLNRDVGALEAQISAIPLLKDLPAKAPDRSALADALARAADHNQRISALEAQRATMDRDHADLAEQIDAAEQRLSELKARRAALAKDIEARKPLEDRIDTEAIREQLRTAEEITGRIDSQTRRAALDTLRAGKQAESDKLTKAMTDRARARREALAAAKMPIEGLTFDVDDRGKAVVLFGGVPFEQASSAEQLRAATAIAMASNPQLRVLRIKDGALLDDDSMAMLAAMADAEDFQLWIEVVRPGEGIGIIIKDGRVEGAEAAAEVAEEGTAGGKELARPAAAKKPAARKGDGDGGKLL